MSRISPFAPLALVALAACTEGNGDNPFDGIGTVTLTTTSSLATPADDGTITHSLTDTKEVAVIDASTDGFGAVVGADGTVLTAQAGTVVTSVFADPPISGTAQWSGDYALIKSDATLDADDQIVSTWTEESGTITLDADFDAQTLTGTQGSLTVAGTYAGQDLGGTVTVDGVDGTLDGTIGATKAIGAFHGTDAASAYAGGFVVE
ncbi:hypothetical protein [Mesobacterium pallidum]|uniref:hypothetical protein n=1 Tax=Mesobacterium pallidum TaxID=2872037 RepID=UPI001EE2290B|nr:hypothetical protein [Mesobacterium pallidum]